MLKKCIWKGEAMPCSELFKTFPTDQGMCCTFNMKKADEMFKDSQYRKLINLMQNKEHKNETSPLQKIVPYAGRKKGLQLILDAHSDYISGGTVSEDFDGFYAIIDSKDQFPTVNRKTVLIRPGHNNIVSMSATKVTADDGIKELDEKKRRCLFQDEKPLYNYMNYTQANCLLECAMDYAMMEVKTEVQTISYKYILTVYFKN